MNRAGSFSEFLRVPPPGWSGILALFSFGIVGNIIALIISALTSNSIWLLSLLVVSIVLPVWGVYRVRRQIEPQEMVPKDERPAKHRGLIILVGPGRPGERPEKQSACPAIEYHLSMEPSKGLAVCWLIATGGEKGSQPVAEQLEAYCKNLKIDARVRRVPDPFSDPYSVQSAYELVDKIYTEEVPEAGLKETEVIADFTGGVRQTSAGMILACGERRPMQYMFGRKEDVASMPILIKFTARSRRGTSGG
jgi:hypothetical protein